MTLLLNLPHCEARRLLASGAPVFLTINPVEYHGPHLSLHNDKLISLGLCRDLHQRLCVRHPAWPLLLAADLEIGVEPCSGPGSRHSRYSVVCELVREACRALVELGARRVVLMTFHGAPLHSQAIEQGVRFLCERGVRAVAPFNRVLAVLVEPESDSNQRFASALAHIPEVDERAEMLRTLRLDFHAGFFETSVALHYAPDSVSSVYRELPPCPMFGQVPSLARAARLARHVGWHALSGELGFAAAGLAWYALRPFPGYTGRPHLASAEAGAHFARFMLDEMAPVVEKVLLGEANSPPPILSWLRLVSLGGRIGGVRLAPEQILTLHTGAKRSFHDRQRAG